MSDTFDADQYEAEVKREGNVVEVIVPEGDEVGMRIDKYLPRFYPEASRTKIQRSIKEGHVRVNGESVQKSYSVEAGDEIVFRLIRKPPMQAEPEPIPLDILYEDKYILVVNKPAGMVVHPAPGHRSGTLVHALLHHVGGRTVSADDEPGGASDDSVGLSMVNALPESPDHPVVRPGIVHRLDKGTSGLLVVAKRDRAHQPLAEQFKAHSVDRMYSALVWGHPDPPNGSIRAAIGRDPHNRQRMAVVSDEDGKWAVTHYETREHLPYASLLSFTLETGRTHQIRVHTQYRNHPIIGDPKYSGRSIQRGPHDAGRKSFFDTVFERLTHPALHAHQLGFRHPITEKKMHFEVDPPSDWQWVLQKLRERAES